MNIRQMAALNVAKILGLALTVGIVFNLGLHYLGLAVMGTVFAVALLAYMIKFAYDIELSKLESKNALDKLKDAK